MKDDLRQRCCRSPNRSPVLLLAALIVTASVAGAAPADPEYGTILATIAVGEIEIHQAAGKHTIIAESFGRTPDVHDAALPMRIFAIAIPPGAELVGLRFEAAPEVVVPGELRISASSTRSYQSVANSRKNGPQRQPVELVGTAAYRGYNLVDVLVTPFFYDPDGARVSYVPEVFISVDYRLPAGSTRSCRVESSAVEATARSIIFNYEQARSWSAQSQGAKAISHDFVLITLEELVPAVAPLVAWQSAKGRSVLVVTLAEISAGPPGIDLAEQIRSFLREGICTDSWGIEDVLIVGHPSDIPMRRTWGEAPAGVAPETDFYYAELSEPDSASWDSNRNGRHGEVTDSLDFYGEVNVGRIPWSIPTIVQGICEKSVTFENNHDDAYKKNVLLLAAVVDANTDGAVFAEYTVDPIIHPWMDQWSVTRLYESSRYASDLPLNRENTVATWAEGSFAVVSWHSHGSPFAVYADGQPYFHVNDTAMLDDDFPAIVSAASCSASDTDYQNLGQSLMMRGAVGFLGANKVAYYGGEWDHHDDGSDQSFKYFFLSEVTSGRMTQGEAHHYALREMYARGLWSFPIYETYIHGSLWGNPDLGLMEPELPRRVRRGGGRVGPGRTARERTGGGPS